MDILKDQGDVGCSEREFICPRTQKTNDLRDILYIAGIYRPTGGHQKRDWPRCDGYRFRTLEEGRKRKERKKESLWNGHLKEIKSFNVQGRNMTHSEDCPSHKDCVNKDWKLSAGKRLLFSLAEEDSERANCLWARPSGGGAGTTTTKKYFKNLR